MIDSVIANNIIFLRFLLLRNIRGRDINIDADASMKMKRE